MTMKKLKLNENAIHSMFLFSENIRIKNVSQLILQSQKQCCYFIRLALFDDQNYLKKICQ